MRISKLIAVAGLMAVLMQSTWASSEYVGERNAFNRFHGFGTYTSTRGDRYEGNWVDGRKQGQGKQVWANGDKYDGTWSDNRPHGNGEMIHISGEIYKGDYVWGKRQGNGTMTYTNKEEYNGAWFQDERHGKGTYKFANGDKYEGEWKNDARSGKGVLTLKNGDRIVGTWQKDKLAGAATYIGNDWRFVGVVKNNKPDGKGTCTESGKSSPCEFANGRKLEPKKVAKKAPAPKPKPPVRAAADDKANLAGQAVAKAVAGENVPTLLAKRADNPEPVKTPAPTKPQFYFEHDWKANGKYEQPSVSWWEKDARDLGDLRIRTENDEYALTMTISDYNGPGKYELGYFSATASQKGVETFASSGDKPGVLVVTHDENGKISGTFSVEAFKNGSISSGVGRHIKNGKFTVVEKPEEK